ncbi:MAG TPA: bifunctional 3-phosphoshikimate 1-carboxyvinyltransferase/cytidylate kinase [Thauera sp.]|uniref:bifunctional 3-phosphoshikimate 1-carboxyvinyltransferase/cytidylate kinase n=1 Tax=Thauera sp. TaxID=1905334 RepID=UPI002C7E76A5|nr:bifunctional 3-phosphoshikimate 1-carboxyvinyltransferase/cytidylate kinase [Thauera sp.]HRP22634.1 bifunctional 3-phosphoshikimate 1-carboxyvinyltransferase/cytidylate kinase [Thauera sp.]HRP64918.1 bifunctional 3-phosphoshikimate 1-carboxyvinyltransferase/cytidylate kinase [Thauera sp.]
MEFLDLPPMLGAAGRVRLPGSKSISNRVLLLAALAEGETDIRDLLMSDDVERMLEALRALGVDWRREGDSLNYRVRGVGGPFPVKTGELFLGNAGTAFRPLTAALALSGGEYRLSGVPRMHERPIGDLVDALRQLGADISCIANEGYPPLHLKPATIRPGGVVRVRGDVSSQFLTALLMALPLTGVETTVEVVGELISKPYIRITLELMARFGVQVQQQGWERFVVPGGARYRSPGTVFVEGDASSASYFLAAGAIGGGPLRVEGVGSASIQGDVRFAEALEQLGARITMGDNWIEAAAPAGGVLKAFDLDLNHIPDAAMTLAVAALFADGPCRLRNIASWRVKETDRIAAMAIELRKVGAEVEEGADYLVVSRPPRLRPAAIDTYDDHRMAMCFSLVSLGGCRVRINDPKCVNKTFPGYFDAFGQVARPVPVVAIDGPSASGKGTVAARVAEALGWHCLDSGSLYRLVALAAMQAGVALDDEAGVAALAASLPARFEGGRVLLGERDVSDEIRSEPCSVGASKVAVLPRVREALLDRQRDYREAPGLVAEGRDMGSVIFPDAAIKVFLTASAESRAQRRHKQLIEKGLPANIQSLLKDLQERDARDAARPVAPLVKMPDAALLDTTERNVDEAVAFVLDLVEAGREVTGR